MDADRKSSKYELTELARLCLPPANRDSNQKLAWVNSVCILFLIIGALGARRPVIAIARPPPLPQQTIPTIIEPPPPTATAPTPVESTEQPTPAAPQAVAVTLDSPAISFSVPTVGNLVVPTAMAVAPPLNPTNTPARLVERPVEIFNTDRGGDRPAPTYPKLALDEGLEGSVGLTIEADENGAVTTVKIEKSSGHLLLDQAAVDVVKKRWILPRGSPNRLFQTSIKFQLQHQHL